MKSQMQGFLDRWEIVALVNGWTEDGDSYEGQIVRDCGKRDWDDPGLLCVSACKSFCEYLPEIPEGCQEVEMPY